MEKQNQDCNEILQYIKNHEKFIRQLHSVKYVWCICDILDSLQIKIFNKNLNEFPDIQKNVYEGGFKIWECEIDGLNFFSNQNIFKNKTVLELGCGSGLIGIYALQQDAQRVFFQDYNKQVLQYHTRINLLLQDKKNLLDRSKFLYGSWSQMSQQKNQFLFNQDNMQLNSIDIIIGGDVLYETQNYKDLLNIFSKYLKPNGCVYIITKMYYFGNGGSYYEFEDFVNKDKRFECSQQKYYKEKVGGNKRVILKLTKKINQ